MATHEQEDRGGDIENPATIASTTSDSSPVDTIILVVMYTIVIILAILISPFALAYEIGAICVTGDIQDPRTCFLTKKDGDLKKVSREPAKLKRIFMKMLDFESTKKKFLRLFLATVTRAGCLALLWLVVNLCVPSLKIVTLFQCPLWKWTLLVVIVLLGYPVTMMVVFTICVTISIFNDEFCKQPNLDYFLHGLQNSLTSLLHFVAILVMWLCYFRTDHGLHPSERVDKFGTWTFVSLLVGAILWVLKRATLLKWQENAVHKRFKGRILTAGFQLYFLTLINFGIGLETLLPWRKEYNSKKNQMDGTNLRIQDFMPSVPVSMNQIDLVVGLVTELAKVAQRENDGILETVAKCPENIPAQDNGETVQYITEMALKENFGLGEEDAQLLLHKLMEEQGSDQITYKAFQKWMVDAYKNLSDLYTLIDAFAMVSVLNRVMIGFIFVVVVLLWLLIIASTKVIVLIASPLLTLSFMFGDTCKTFFQGVIFLFVTHPYNIGDCCIIEGIELVVKRIDIQVTTFLKLGTKEEIIYSNASLATKLITNLKGEPDPSDKIELNLDSSTTKLKIEGLKNDLDSYFNDTRQREFYEKNIQVLVKEIGNSIKVSISFTHVMNVYEVSHSLCLQKKNMQRSDLFLEVMKFLEEQGIKLATP